MNSQNVIEAQIVPKHVLIKSVEQFCQVFANASQYITYMQAKVDLNNDEAAHKAAQAYLRKKNSLRFVRKDSPEYDQALQEVQSLKEAYEELPVVRAYMTADTELRAISESVGQLLSSHIEMDFGLNCLSGNSCC